MPKPIKIKRKPPSSRAPQILGRARQDFGSQPTKIVHKAPEIIASPQVRFPGAWGWFFDEAVTSWVKNNYSPKESWKGKPFSKEDSKFFFRGIDELSEIFTEERSRGIPQYFNHSKFRSAYLLYFFPLQAAKFISVYQLHAKAFEAAIEHGRREGEMRIVDLGAGPGTASISALLQLLQMATASGDELPKIRMLWIDTNMSAMQDGKKLAEQLASHFSRLRGKLEIELKTGPWWKATQFIGKPTSLMLLGHVVNESAGPDKPVSKSFKRGPESVVSNKYDDDSEVADGMELASGDFPSEAPGEFENDVGEEEFDLPETDGNWGKSWKQIFARAAGGGTLIVEPASKKNSQYLSQLRDEFFNHGLLEKDPSSIWGPCLHSERCPLAIGRDWCHFSIPAHVPGAWFLEFSKALGSERQWLKFSYLWIASQLDGETRAPVAAANLRRVVSDPLIARETGPRSSVVNTTAPSVLICEPETPGRLTVPRTSELKRGDLVRLK
jgi:hypothetical protein